MKAIETAGYKPGDDVMLALDCASTEFFKDGKYEMEGEGKALDSAGMAKYLADLGQALPDHLHRGRHGRGRLGRLEGADRAHRQALPARRRRPVRHQHRAPRARASRQGIANSILVKVNQIGSLTETLDAVDMAQRAGYTAVMSHRSGETEDLDHRRPRGRHQLRADQDRLAVALRPAGEVQPADPHRGGAWAMWPATPARAYCAARLGLDFTTD